MALDTQSLLDPAHEALPKHERLRDYLILQFRGGRLRPGEALPTENELAVSAKMSRNTVRQALMNLERNGLIRRIRGRGTFVHESAMDRLTSGLDYFALLIPDTRGGYYPSLQRGFHEASAERHNQVIIGDTDDDPLRQADSLLQLMDKKVAGIAIVPTTSPITPPYQIHPVQQRGIPVVFCHRRVEGVQAPLVTFAAADVGKLAGEAMIAHGHRRVAMFSAKRAGLSMLYEQSLRSAVEAGGGELPVAFVRHGNVSKMTADHEQFLQNSLDEILELPERPTAIFCAFDSDAEVIYLRLNEKGINVPGQISVIGFGGKWRNGAIARRLTSVAVNEEELGRRTVALLDEMRCHKRPLTDMTEIVLPLGWTDGETLGPAPACAAGQ